MSQKACNKDNILYSKACVKQTISKRPKIGFQYQLSLNAGQKYCYHLSLRSLLCLFFLSGRFTQVLLYLLVDNNHIDSVIHP